MIDVISIKDPANYLMIAYIGKIEKIFLKVGVINDPILAAFLAKFNLKDGVLHPKIENIPNKVRKKDEAFQKQPVLFNSFMSYLSISDNFISWLEYFFIRFTASLELSICCLL